MGSIEGKEESYLGSSVKENVLPINRILEITTKNY